MAIHGGPDIVTDSLTVFLDWGKTTCYPGTGTTFNNIIDSTVNNGFLKNNVSFNAGNSGYIHTNGANNGQQNNVGDRIDINTSAAGRDRFSKSHNFTLLFWNYYISGSGRIMSTGSAGSGTGNNDSCVWQMFISNTNFSWWNAAGGAYYLDISYGSSRAANTWQLVGFTHTANDGANNVGRIYVDGNEIASQTVLATSSSIDRSGTTSLQWTLGGGYSGSCFTSNSQNRFGPFFVYNKALTAAEMQQNYAALRGRYGV